MQENLTILVLNYNKFELTRHFFENNEKFVSGCRWLLVDNGSEKNIVDSLKTWGASCGWNIWEMNNGIFEKKFGQNGNPSHDLLLLKENTGYARGNNTGIQLIESLGKPDFICIVNNDITWTEDIIHPLVDELKRHEDLAVIAPRIIDTTGKEQNPQFMIEYTKMPQTWFRLIYPVSVILFKMYSRVFNYDNYNKSLFSNTKEILYLDPWKHCFMGSCFAIKYDIFKEMGFFDPNTFLGAEEPILVNKLRNKGYKIGILPSVKVLHDQGATCRSVLSTRQVYELFETSDAYYLEKYCHYSKNKLKLIRLSRNYFREIWLPWATRLHNSLKKCK